MRDRLGGGLDPVLPVPLGLVEGGVRRREQLGGRRCRRRGGDAEAGRDGDRGAVAGEDDASREGLADALGDPGAAGEVGARKDEEELLPPPAAGEGNGATRLLRPL